MELRPHQNIQGFTQDILEEEITELLGDVSANSLEPCILNPAEFTADLDFDLRVENGYSFRDSGIFSSGSDI